MNFPKIPQPLKAPPPKPVTKAPPEVDDARENLREIHIRVKEARKNPPEDVKGAVWLLSLAKVLDETLDEYFKRIGP